MYIPMYLHMYYVCKQHKSFALVQLNGTAQVRQMNLGCESIRVQCPALLQASLYRAVQPRHYFRHDPPHR